MRWLLIAALMFATPAVAQDWRAETVIEGLNYPWDIVADGPRFIITEKSGQIAIVEGQHLRRTPIQTSDPLRTDGGAGLMGIALAPDFAATGRAFLYYSYDDNGPLNRIVAAQFDGETWRETAILIDAIPGHRLYNGGRIAIGPDGHLYATTGWTENRDRPQDPTSLAGKTLRVALDGSIPADNPVPGLPLWSLGHRNPQGLAFSPAGELFVAEHGQSALDEVNLIHPGANYGWPLVQGDQTLAGTEPPFTHSGSTTWAPSGAAFAGDRLLVAGLRGGLLALDRDARRMVRVADTGDRLRQVLPVGADIYVITTNRSPRGAGPSQDRLIRLSPTD